VDPTLRDILLAWTWDPLILVGLAVIAAVYGIGFWHAVHEPARHPRVRWRGRHAWLFYGGLGVIFLALISSIDALGARVFWGHMVQHILLLTVAPPLLLLGTPLGPVLHAVPRNTRRSLVHALAANGRLRHTAGWLTRPMGAFVVFNVVLWVWHVPTLYDAALTHSALHAMEHLTMLGAGILFWWPIVEPAPVWKPSQGLWRVAYPVLAAIPGGILGVWLSEAGASPLYTYYLHTSQLFGFSATEDQQLGGALMLGVDEPIVFAACAVLFFRYLAEVERRQSLAEMLAARGADADGAATVAVVSED
jgi:cytochrome c oxidase assembly factor CtaG